MRNIPLLLTATISPQTTFELNLIDAEKRYKQYINNLVRFITRSNFQEFIFCENSGTSIPDKDMIEKLCNFYGKKIEFLSFVGNIDLIKKYTRAYGDQEIMEYALDNSEILAHNTSFYKITGRYRVKNINNIIEARLPQDTIFIKGGVGMNTVHTCFFKTTKEFFTIHFAGKYQQLANFENHSLERLYYYYIKQSGVNMTIHNVHPVFSGEYGAGGIMDESWYMKIKTKLFAHMGVYDIYTTKI